MTADLHIAGGHGGAFRANIGDLVTIIDVDGQQAVDFVAFNADDLSEVLSGIETRRALRCLYIKVGDVLRSSRSRAMIEIVADTIGVHDFTIPACDASRYAVDFGCPGHRNCLDNMAEPLRAYGIADPLAIPEPFNFFQSSPVIEGGRTAVIDPPSRAGDRIVLKLLMNAVCAVSSCPQDIIPGNGLVPSAIAVEVRSGGTTRPEA
jgi:uncharacterized protein YcgI (DUF1989 family)